MLQPIPYLSYNGDCADAMRFYEKALGGKLEKMITNAETPMAADCGKDALDKICHACLVLPGGAMLFAGDCPPQMPYEGIKGVSLTLNYETVAEAERVFKALSDGGKVVMPMSPAFWAKRFGMVTDRFGCPWIVNGESIPL